MLKPFEPSVCCDLCGWSQEYPVSTGDLHLSSVYINISSHKNSYIQIIKIPSRSIKPEPECSTVSRFWNRNHGRLLVLITFVNLLIFAFLRFTGGVELHH